MRRRFFSSEPGRTAKCTCPSWSMATTRTTARTCLKRAEQLFGLQPPVVIGLQPESVIDPGAYALGVASGYSFLRHRH
jgi:hypothetical protein